MNITSAAAAEAPAALPETDPDVLARFQEFQRQASQAQAATATPETNPEVLARFKLDREVSSGKVDQESGAPAFARFLVESAHTPRDRLATLKTIYPDAEPYGDKDFIFTNPQTGKRSTFYAGKASLNTAVNSLPGYARDAATTAGMVGGGILGGLVGGVGGAAAGTPAGPPGMVAGAGAGLITGADVGAGIGAAGTGELFDAFMHNVMGVADTRSTGEHAVDTAVEGGAAMAGGPILKGASAAGKAALGAGKEVFQRAADFASENIRPMASDLTQSKWMQWLTNAAGDTLGGADVIRRRIGQTLDDAKSALDRVVSGYGPALGRQGAGEELQIAGENAMNRFKAAAAEKYGTLSKFIAPEIPVDTPGYRAALDAVRQSMPTAEATAAELQSPLAQRLSQALTKDTTKGPISFADVQGIRSRIGDMLADPQFFADTGRGELKRIYTGLSQDLKAAAAKVSPEAVNAFNDATNFYSTGIQAAETAWKGILDKGVSPERAYQSAVRQTNLGGTKIGEIMAQLTPTERGMMSATVLDLLGKGGKEGADFNLKAFMNGWRTMSPDARTSLFQDNQAMRQSLDKVVGALGLMEQSGTLVNTSRTAGTLSAMEILKELGNRGVKTALVGAGIGGAATLTGATPGEAGSVGLAGAVMGPYFVSKLITSPTFVRWLTTPVPANGFAAHLGRLTALATADKSIAPAVSAYLGAARTQSPEAQQ